MACLAAISQIEPMTLANMRENGVLSLTGDLTVPSFGPRMECTKCGTIGADVRPNWQERERP
jgi:hypothetical protein